MSRQYSIKRIDANAKPPVLNSSLLLCPIPKIGYKTWWDIFAEIWKKAPGSGRPPRPDRTKQLRQLANKKPWLPGRRLLSEGQKGQGQPQDHLLAAGEKGQGLPGLPQGHPLAAAGQKGQGQPQDRPQAAGQNVQGQPKGRGQVKFVFVREPFSRLLSAYVDKLLIPNKWFTKVGMDGWMDECMGGWMDG
jgi:hypothetical protein